MLADTYLHENLYLYKSRLLGVTTKRRWIQITKPLKEEMFNVP